MKKTYPLEDLDCAACAAEMEEAASHVPGVQAIRVDYLKMALTLTAEDDVVGQGVSGRGGHLCEGGAGMQNLRHPR